MFKSTGDFKLRLGVKVRLKGVCVCLENGLVFSAMDWWMDGLILLVSLSFQNHIKLIKASHRAWYCVLQCKTVMVKDLFRQSINMITLFSSITDKRCLLKAQGALIRALWTGKRVLPKGKHDFIQSDDVCVWGGLAWSTNYIGCILDSHRGHRALLTRYCIFLITGLPRQK